MENKYQDMSLQQLAEHYQQVHADMDKLSAELHSKQKEWEALRNNILPQKMEELGLEQYSFTESHTLNLRVDGNCSVPKAMLPELSQWLGKVGRSDLILQRLDTKKFKRFMQDQISFKKEIPPTNIVTYTAYKSAQVITRK